MTRLTVAAVLSVMVLSVPALAQQPVVSAPAPAPLKMAFVDLQRVAAESNEGKAASGKVQGLTQKKTAELTEKTKSLQSNQQKLQQGGAVLNEAARAQAQREVDRLTVEIDRFQQDAQAEVQELQEQLQGEFQRRRRGRHLHRSVVGYHAGNHQAVRLFGNGQAGDRRETHATGSTGRCQARATGSSHCAIGSSGCATSSSGRRSEACATGQALAKGWGLSATSYPQPRALLPSPLALSP
jgi:Skp family chaperone for outer membrane proteins